MELRWSWVWSQQKMYQGHLYLQMISRWMNVEIANCITSIMLVHDTCLYPSWWAMLHATNDCAPRKGIIPRSPQQYPTGLYVPPHTIWIFGYIRMAKIHDPILQCMYAGLPCQQSDTVLWWTRQSLWQWCTKKNDVQKHLTLCSKRRRLHQLPAQL